MRDWRSYVFSSDLIGSLVGLFPRLHPWYIVSTIPHVFPRLNDISRRLPLITEARPKGRSCAYRFVVAILLLFMGNLITAADTTAFTGARLMPVSGPIIEDGVLVVRGGKIESIGASKDVVIPTGAVRIDASGKTIIPGLICTHSHIGMGGGGDSSDPIQPECWTLDSVNVRAASLERARAGGLTLVNQMPGSGHLISGRTTYLKLPLS